MTAYKRRWYLANKERWSSYKKAQDPVKANVKTQEWRRNHSQRFRESEARATQARRAWYQALKAAPCTDCAKTYPPYVMEWDHVRGKKLNHVSVIAMRTPKHLVLAEIAKCELVCANCHRIRTWSAETRAKIQAQIRASQAAHKAQEQVA